VNGSQRRKLALYEGNGLRPKWVTSPVNVCEGVLYNGGGTHLCRRLPLARRGQRRAPEVHVAGSRQQQRAVVTCRGSDNGTVLEHRQHHRVLDEKAAATAAATADAASNTRGRGLLDASGGRCAAALLVQTHVAASLTRTTHA
jgi:hypothetical protein